MAGDFFKALRLFLSFSLSVFYFLSSGWAAADSSSYEIVLQNGHTDRIYAVDFHPDGTYIATASGDGTVRLWNIRCELIRIFRGHVSMMDKVAFSPDGRYMAGSSSFGAAVRVWSLTGELICSVDGHAGFCFSPDSARIITWGGSWAARKTGVSIWAKDGRLLRTIDPREKVIKNAAVSPDGNYLAVDTGEGTVRLMTIGGDPVRMFPAPGAAELRFSPDGRYLAAGDQPIFNPSASSVSLWTFEGELLFSHQGHSRMALSPDGGLAVSYRPPTDSALYLWSRSGRLLHTLEGHDLGITGVVFTPDSKHILSCSADGTVNLWSLDGEKIRTYDLNGGAIGLALSPDGRHVAAVGGNLTGEGGAFKLWFFTGEPLFKVKSKSLRIADVGFSPDGRYLACGLWPNGVHLWSTEGGLLWTKTGPDLQSSGPTEIAFDEAGKFLTSHYHGAFKDDIRTWSIPEGAPLDMKAKADPGRILHEFANRPDSHDPALSSPDKKQSAVVCNENGAWVLSVRNDKIEIIRSFTINETPPGSLTTWLSVAFSPDWKYMANCTWDNTIRLWTPDGALIKTLAGHTQGVYGLTFSQDGKYLVSGSLDNTTRIWNIDSGDWAELSAFTTGEWFVLHSSGRFDCSDDGRIYIRTVKGLDVFPQDEVMEDFYIQGLLGKFLRGEIGNE